MGAALVLATGAAAALPIRAAAALAIGATAALRTGAAVGTACSFRLTSENVSPKVSGFDLAAAKALDAVRYKHPCRAEAKYISVAAPLKITGPKFSSSHGCKSQTSDSIA
jgi:hypothetical protein